MRIVASRPAPTVTSPDARSVTTPCSTCSVACPGLLCSLSSRPPSRASSSWCSGWPAPPVSLRDARPSDALALAVRVGAPIYAMPSVLDQAGLGAESVGDDEEAGELLESTGERLVDPRLDVFRDFVNSLDVDPDAERGS